MPGQFSFKEADLYSCADAGQSKGALTGPLVILQMED